jgi:hypothetical protein
MFGKTRHGSADRHVYLRRGLANMPSKRQEADTATRRRCANRSPT